MQNVQVGNHPELNGSEVKLSNYQFSFRSCKTKEYLFMQFRMHRDYVLRLPFLHNDYSVGNFQVYNT